MNRRNFEKQTKKFLFVEKVTYFRLAQASKPTSAAILLLAYSIRIGPRSEDSKKEPCREANTCAAQHTSWYSMKATGDPPLLCMRRRQKPGKLCNKNTTSAAQWQAFYYYWGLGIVPLFGWYKVTKRHSVIGGAFVLA